MKIENIYEIFPSQSICFKYIAQARWGNAIACPYCSFKKISPISREGYYRCNKCNTSFSSTTYTIFHKTKIDLRKWFFIIYAFSNTTKKIGVRQLSRDIDINKNTASRILIKIRRAFLESDEVLYKINKVIKKNLINNIII